jgi:hypothetical protein
MEEPRSEEILRWTLDDAAAVLLRIRGEFREMPGLKLTTQQAARLWHLDPGHSEALLNALVVDGLLARSPAGAYVVASDLTRARSYRS